MDDIEEIINKELDEKSIEELKEQKTLRKENY